MTQRAAARSALREALSVRTRLNLGLVDPICIYDVAERLGLEVRFVDLPSLEGLYLDLSRPTILLSSLRPAGRRRFTCAHEMAHHLLGHGTRVDEVQEASARKRSSYDVREFTADCFAGFLLMPKTATAAAFAARGIKLASAGATDIYNVAQQFGVGYRTLLSHMSRSLGLMTHASAMRLAKVPLSRIRLDLLGFPESRDVFLVDRHWRGRAIDVEVGDLLVFRDGIAASRGPILECVVTRSTEAIYRATAPGLISLGLADTEWGRHVRISRAGYTGRATFRHLDDPPDG
jgi:Zn-dependent peptidase ImmA (M78 family)